MKKKIIIALIILVVIIIIIANIKGSRKKVNVYTHKTEIGDVISYVSAPGHIISKNEVNISSQVMGKLIEIKYEEGDKVKKGDTLAILDDFDARMTLKKAKSGYMAQKASVEYKRAVFEKQKILFKKNFTSEESYQAQKLDCENALHLLSQSEAQYESAKKNLEHTRIISPINGTIIDKKVKEGETVIIGTMNNPGTVLFKVADLDNMQMEAMFDESDIPDIKKEMKARIVVDPIPEDTFEAIVSDIASAGDIIGSGTSGEITNFEVKADIINPSQKIKSGMGGNLDIISKSVEDVIKVPLTAIQKRKIDDKFEKGIFILNNGKVHFKTVEEGITGENDVEIISGLNEGEIVIIGPYSSMKNLKDGDIVKVDKKKEGKRGKKKVGKEDISSDQKENESDNKHYKNGK